MGYDATIYNIMIASPADVAEERRIAREVIGDWNAVHSRNASVALMPIAWDTHAVPSMRARGQEVINTDVLIHADLLLAIFWTRIGTPTGTDRSGTVEEIRKHVAAGKPTLIYFSSRPVTPDSVDPDQYHVLSDFKKECKQSGLVETYDNVEDFRSKFARHLAITMNGLVGTATSNSAAISPSLSQDAQDLLLQATRENGHILRYQTLAGWFVKTASRTFTEDQDARSAARWLAAVDELVQADMVTRSDSDGNVFRATHQGYASAEALSGTSQESLRLKRVAELQEKALKREEADRRHSTYRLPVRIDLMPGERRPCLRFDPPSPDLQTIEYFDFHKIRVGQRSVGGGNATQPISVPLDIDVLEKIFTTSDTKAKEYAHFSIHITYQLEGIDRTFTLPCRLQHQRSQDRHTAFTVIG